MTLTVCLLVLSGCAAVNRTGWLSSSNSFTLTASSSLDGFPPENAVPTSSSSWSAAENDDEQWIQVSDVINMLSMLTKKPATEASMRCDAWRYSVS